jgi:thiol-disulfide isomerase/thioredoxin
MKSTGRFEKMRQVLTTVVVALLLALNTTSCNGMSENPGGEGSKPDHKTKVAAGKDKLAQMPAFELVSAIDGSSVRSDRYQGQILLVTFFATWCSPCLEEIPSLKELQVGFGPKGFSVIALSMDEDGPDVVKRLVERSKINYPVLMADRQVAHGFGGVSGLPTTFLINREGSMVRRYLGYVGHDVLERDIEELLSEDRGQTTEAR